MNQIFTGWTFNSPWLEDYLVFDAAAATNTSLPQLFDGAFSNTNGGGGTWTFYDNAIDAYNAAISQGYYDLLRTSATGGRDSINDVTTYTFTNAETLIFVVPDYGLGDNAGGVSVVISPAIVPVLNISQSGNTVTVYWENVSGWTLQQNNNLANTGTWSVNSSWTTTNGTNYLNLTPPTGNLFFRLTQP